MQKTLTSFYDSTGKRKGGLLESAKDSTTSSSCTPSAMADTTAATAVEQPMATCSSHQDIIHSEEETTWSSVRTVFRRLSVVSTSSDCYPFSSTGTASVTTSDRQTEPETSSDSLCETEAEADNTSSEERPPKSKVSKRSIVNKSVVFGKSSPLRKSKTPIDFKTKHPWLSFDSQKKGAYYCKFCQKFYSGERGLPKGSDGVFITKPFTKWFKATGSTKKNNRLLKHQESQAHKLAISQAELCENMTRRGSVYTQLYSRGASDSDRCLNLMMLCKYIKIVYWLLKHEIAHTTNYQSLIELCTECDESGDLASWQQQRPDNATYTPAATSAEMIKAVGQYFDEKNTEKFWSSPVLSLMCDESTDLRNRTELSMCVRI